MLPTAETELTPTRGRVSPAVPGDSVAPVTPLQASTRQGLRGAALVLAGALAFFAIVLLAYELAVARVPQHRAALERIVRAQTGLDVRFNELGLRWGWYGPEAVFRRVELGEPGRSTVLLRAPELVVGFDAWRTLRSGQLEAGRITLISPDIDFERVGSPPGGARATGASHDEASARRTRILQRWQGGRVDIEGGTLRLPDPGGSANPLTLQIRRASLRRATSEWSGYGLVFLPERLGRTARIVMRLDGDLEKPTALSGTARFEGRRLLFAGWRDWLSAAPDAARYLPRAGGGDVTVNVDFEKGRILKASGKISAGGLEFDAQGIPALAEDSPASGVSASNTAGAGVLTLDHLRGEWRLAQRGSNWRLQVDSLELGEAANQPTPATFALDVARSGAWAHGQLEHAPLQSVVAIARWFAPQLDLAGVELGGSVRDGEFDWNASRAAGQRLRASTRLVDVAVAPPSHGFALTGLSGLVSGDESNLTADLRAQAARLELARAPQYPLDDVHVAARLQISRTDGGWRVTTEKLELQHGTTRLSVDGSLTGDGLNRAPEIAARAGLSGADVPLLEKLAGASLVETLGATFSHLAAGRIEHAEIELRGPLDETLPLRNDGAGFTGSLILRDAILSGGDLWPDAHGLDAHIDWRGPRIHAAVDQGHAGSFELTSANAEWDAQGQHAAHITGRLTGRLEEALAWMRDHPKLQEYAPRIQDIDMRGAAQLEFSLTLPAATPAAQAGASEAHAQVPVDVRASDLHARVSVSLDGARLQALAGVPPIDAVRGTLVFESGHMRRSMLTGSWLGGPVTLNVGERREHGALVLAIEGRGQLDARQLVLAAAAGTAIDATRAPAGNAEWSGELAYFPGADSRSARWRVRADSSLLGITSQLPEPLAKAAATAVPLHIEVQGTSAVAELRVNVGDRVRSVFSLRGREDVPWQVERGSVHFGTTPARLPAEPVVLVEGRVNRLDLPAYVAAWQQLRQDPFGPAIRAELVAGELLAAGHSYSEVTVLAERTEAGADLQLHSADIAGMAHWPAVATASRPAQFHFARLNVPAGAAFDASVELIAALGPAAELSVEDLIWDGHSLGRATATIESSGTTLDVRELRLTGSTQDVTASVRCQSAACRLKFSLDSSNGAATLEDFGFRPDLTAARALLEGDLEWRPRSDQPVLATLVGRLRMRLEDGTTRADPGPDVEGLPFALLAVPALVSGMGQPPPQNASLQESAPRELHFSQLAADFELRAGDASTSNLHFDGDAEILMRGRTGLVARDYDQQVWILRGEGRLPAAVRRLGPSPRVAAVWLSLRELFTGGDRTDNGAGAALHLQGSWDDPIVVAAE
ncbi:MAG: hypothetical protein JWM63_296 [Gammaproteobacteria bacterium]|nr:hypothetical protein [Gammaproteobacteria bacterium]